MTEKVKREAKPKVPRRPASVEELTDMKAWLSTLQIGVDISVKVNGPYHPTAVVVVDLGQPVKQIRLTSEQVSELAQRLKRTTREIIGRDTTIRVSVDNSHGIHWASIPA